MNWTAANIPDQSGRTAVVTGSNTGLGYQSAKALPLQARTILLVTRHVRFGRIRRRRHTDGWGAAVGRLDLRSDLSGITLQGTIAAQCLLGGSGIAGGPPEDGTASFCAQSRTAAVPPSKHRLQTARRITAGWT